MRRTRHSRAPLGDEAGFGLIELMSALAVSSLGILALAGIGLAIGAQARLARWDTDGALAARETLERAVGAGFGAIASGAARVSLPPRAYPVSRTVVSVSPRLEEIRALVSSATGRAPAGFATRLAAPRPVPAAP